MSFPTHIYREKKRKNIHAHTNTLTHVYITKNFAKLFNKIIHNLSNPRIHEKKKTIHPGKVDFILEAQH